MTEPSPLYKLLYELNGKVEAQGALLKSIDTKLTGHIEDDEAVEKRVSGLERRESYKDGKTAGIAAVVSLGAVFVGKWLGLHP